MVNKGQIIKHDLAIWLFRCGYYLFERKGREITLSFNPRSAYNRSLNVHIIDITYLFRRKVRFEVNLTQTTFLSSIIRQTVCSLETADDCINKSHDLCNLLKQFSKCTIGLDIFLPVALETLAIRAHVHYANSLSRHPRHCRHGYPRSPDAALMKTMRGNHQKLRGSKFTDQWTFSRFAQQKYKHLTDAKPQYQFVDATRIYI